MLSPSATAKDRNRRPPFTSFKASLGLQTQSVTAHGFGRGTPADPQHPPKTSIAPEQAWPVLHATGSASEVSPMVLRQIKEGACSEEQVRKGDETKWVGFRDPCNSAHR